MKIYISGQHTAPCGDFPYDKGGEFLRELKNEWSAIYHFHFNSIDGADIFLKKEKIIQLTVQEVYDKLNSAIKNAAKNCSWNIWYEV